jgi:ABC-type transporter MlaC component
MKKLVVPIVLLLILSSCQELLNVIQTTSQGSNLPSITQNEAASGLKQALETGVANGTSFLGKKDGFLKNAAYKILMPDEVQNAMSKIEGNRLANALAGPYFEKVVNSMNAGAENAMAEAKPIFLNAITSMSITDAIKIVTGGEGAATNYLKNATSTQLKEKFTPVIKKSLDNLKIDEPWTKVSSAYNMAMGKSVQTNLNDYVTDKAMAALFSQVKLEEDKIRQNPAARATDLLKKVFGYADSNK